MATLTSLIRKFLSKLTKLDQNENEVVQIRYIAVKFMRDSYEKQILKELQTNDRASTQELSEAVGLSQSPCWRRVKRLEEDGYIKRYSAILDGKKLGLNALAHVQVSFIDHTQTSIDIFQTFVEKLSKCWNADP